MKIIRLNNVDNLIFDRAVSLNDRYLAKFEIEAGLFQSQSWDKVEWVEENKLMNAPAMLVAKPDYPILVKTYREIGEIETYFLQSELIVWFGKSVFEKDKYDLEHVVAHELQHVVQREVSLTHVYKNRILDLVLREHYLPAEADANNAANMMTDRIYDKNYKWVDEVEKLFRANENKIRKIYTEIAAKDKRTGTGGKEVADLNMDKNKAELFRYYVNKVLGI